MTPIVSQAATPMAGTPAELTTSGDEMHGSHDDIWGSSSSGGAAAAAAASDAAASSGTEKSEVPAAAAALGLNAEAAAYYATLWEAADTHDGLLLPGAAVTFLSRSGLGQVIISRRRVISVLCILNLCVYMLRGATCLDSFQVVNAILFDAELKIPS